MEQKSEIQQLEAKIFHWRDEGLDSKKKDKWMLTAEEVGFLIEDLTLKSIQSTEITNLNAQITRDRNKYQELYDSYPEGYLALEEDGKIIEVNQNMAQLLEANKPELVTLKLSQFISPDSQEKFTKYLSDLLQTKTRQTCEISLKKKTGPELRVQLSGILIIDPEKKSGLCRLSVSQVKEPPSAQTSSSGASTPVTQEFKDYVRQKLYEALRQDYHSPENPMNEKQQEKAEKPVEKAEKPQEKALVPIS